jgi:hypothetical protein
MAGGHTAMPAFFSPDAIGTKPKKRRLADGAAIFLALWFYVKLKFVPTGHATSIFFAQFGLTINQAA